MRVLAFVNKQPGISPGQRFRIEQWAPHLSSAHGIEVEYAVFESSDLTRILYQPGHVREKATHLLADTWRRRRDVLRARRYDAAFVFREVALFGPAVYERALHLLDVPFVLDFDDAIWMPSVGGAANGVFSRLRFPGKTRTIARKASAVTVGNGYLADWARGLNGDVTVVPTTIDLGRYTVQPEREHGTFVVVWMGSFSTLKYLELVRRPIEALGRERPVELRVICDRPLERPFAGVQNTFVPWSAEREAEDIGAGDVGIMPLDDTPYSRGKCACKALQYMAAGRPTVLAPVGVNVDVVREGETGLFAAREDEWLGQLRRLAGDRDLRRRLATAGRQTVERGYSSAIGAERLAAVLRRIARPPRHGAAA
jgi:glycosyltransferase involved in cell wall biosynthesis